jgi:uncharacterized membrane protein YkoI
VVRSGLDLHFSSAVHARWLTLCFIVGAEVMKMKSRIGVPVLIALLGLAPAAFSAETQAALQKEAKISMQKAREIALKKVPGGKIESGELEREHGKLIYSFDIKTKEPGVTEVNVNALDGKIVAVQKENAAKEAAEKKQEAKEKTVKH